VWGADSSSSAVASEDGAASDQELAMLVDQVRPPPDTLPTPPRAPDSSVGVWRVGRCRANMVLMVRLLREREGGRGRVGPGACHAR